MFDRKRYCKEYNKVWYQKNKERRLKEVAEYVKANPDKVEKWLLKFRCKKYGLTVQQYLDLKIKQNNLCAICQQPNKSERCDFHIDHDHRTGKVRGLVCNNCNRGLGYFADNPIVLRLAASYLEQN